ncbi:MAG: hypothetical protein HDKAJFGB_04000 [Anaerolineae bacterium]|nr:hypothetical protein [Anaerolineae bacterium]
MNHWSAEITVDAIRCRVMVEVASHDFVSSPPRKRGRRRVSDPASEGVIRQTIHQVVKDHPVTK